MNQSQSDKSELQRRIRKTQRNLEVILRPLYEMIRDHSLKVQDQASLNPNYISEFSNECSRMIENYCFQLMAFTIEYIFTNNDYRFEFKALKSYKMLLVLSMERLKLLFTENPNKMAHKLVTRMEQMKQDEDLALDEEEGFFGSEEEKEKNTINLSVFMKNEKYAHLLIDPEFQIEKILILLQEKDDLIKLTQLKLLQRERTLTEITSGYLKDLQIMREQIYRKNNNSEEVDLYEVQYFDCSEVEDPLYLTLVNNKLADLKSQYEKKTRDFIKKIENQKQEVSDLRYQIQGLVQKTQNQDNPEYLLQKVFHLEDDPYKIWKFMQDAKGNKYFFEVFEKQKTQYGIDYKEINKLLMQTKAYDREFEYYRKGLDDQMISFLESTMNCMNEAKQDKTTKDQVIEDQNNQIIQLKELKNLNLIEQIEVALQSWKQLQINQSLFQNRELKFAFNFWSFKNKIQKTIDQESLDNWTQQLADSYFQDKNPSNLENKLFNINEDYKNFTIKTEILRIENDQLNSNLVSTKMEVNNLSSMLEIEKENSRNIMAKLNNQEKLNHLIIKHLDPKMQNASIDGINLEDDRRESTKSIKERIKQLDNLGIRYIREITKQYDKNLIGLETLSEVNQARNQSTLTNIFDINRDLDKIYLEEKQKSMIQSENIEAQVSKQKETSTQTILKSEDILEMELNNQQLQEHVTFLKLQASNIPVNKQKMKNVNTNSLSPETNPQVSQRSKYSNKMNQKFPNIVTETNQQNKALYTDIKSLEEVQFQSHQYCEQQENMVLSYSKRKRYSFQTHNDEQSVDLPKLYSQNSDQKIDHDIKNTKYGVFSRLFDDSKLKQQRIDQLKERLIVLESEKWTDMFQTMNQNNQKDNKSEFQQLVTLNKLNHLNWLKNQQKYQDRLQTKNNTQTTSQDKLQQQEYSGIMISKGVAPWKQKRAINANHKRFKEFQVPMQSMQQQQKEIQGYFQQLNQDNYMQGQRRYIKNMITESRDSRTFSFNNAKINKVFLSQPKKQKQSNSTQFQHFASNLSGRQEE